MKSQKSWNIYKRRGLEIFQNFHNFFKIFQSEIFHRAPLDTSETVAVAPTPLAFSRCSFSRFQFWFLLLPGGQVLPLLRANTWHQLFSTVWPRTACYKSATDFLIRLYDCVVRRCWLRWGLRLSRFDGELKRMEAHHLALEEDQHAEPNAALTRCCLMLQSWRETESTGFDESQSLKPAYRRLTFRFDHKQSTGVTDSVFSGGKHNERQRVEN